MSRAVMGVQTDLDSLQAAALRQARDPRAGAPKGKSAEVRDLTSKLHVDLSELARRHAGPIRVAIEKIDARVASLAESLGRVTARGEEMAPDLEELQKPLLAIRADLEALKLTLAAENRPPVDVLLGLVAKIEDRVGRTKTK